MGSRSASSRLHYVLNQGVVGWGLPTGVLWSVGMSVRTGKPLTTYLPIALVMFPIGGIAIGLFRRSFLGGPVDPVESRDDRKTPTQEAELPTAAPLRADTRPVRAIGLAAMALSAAFVGLACVTHQAWVATGFAIFFLLGTWLVASAGTLQVTRERIGMACSLGFLAIGWDEIRYVETDRARSSLVFVSDDKRFPIPGGVYWGGPDAPAMRRSVDAELRRRGIPIRVTQRAMFPLPKNVRVRRSP